jgi:hypothetical protein
LKRILIRKVDPANQGAMGPLMCKGEKEVVTNVTNTPKVIPKGRHIEFQVHILPESIGDMKWMN